jgi:hypothetical protein
MLSRLGYNDLKEPFNAALRPVFERHGLDWRLNDRFGRAAGYAMYALSQ